MNRAGLITMVVFSLIAVPVSFAQNNLQDQQQKLQESIDNVNWKNLSIEFYDIKDKAQNGYKPMVVKSTDDKNGKTFYIGKKPVLDLKDTRSIDVSYSPGDGDTLRLMVRFNPAGKKELFDYSSAHINEMMGVVIDGKLRLVAQLRQPLNNGRVQVYGFEAKEALDILKRYYEPKLEVVRKFNNQMAALPAAKK